MGANEVRTTSGLREIIPAMPHMIYAKKKS
jgi:hypothetical protein